MRVQPTVPPIKLLLSLLGLAFVGIVQGATPVTYVDGRLSNGIIAVDFGEEGGFSIEDAESAEPLLSKARFGLPRGKRGKIVKMLAEDFEDALGTGMRVVLDVADFDELGYGGRPPAAGRGASMPIGSTPILFTRTTRPWCVGSASGCRAISASG